MDRMKFNEMVDSVQAGVYNAPCKGKDVFSVYIWKDVFALFYPKRRYKN